MLENTGGATLVWLVGLHAMPTSQSIGDFERHASFH
jgi:hypothetical protein